MGDFTPISGFAGGLLIGLAVALMLLLNGRVAGISGIVGGLLTLRTRDTIWRAAFVTGLVLGVLGYLSPAASWSASGRAWAPAAPAATASAGWPASPAAPWSQRPRSSGWRCSPCS